MATERSPAFQFYVRDWLGDARVRAMTPEARGVYVDLLCYCWQEIVITGDLDTLARLGGVSPSTMKRLWPQIDPCFIRNDDHTLRHARLDREREAQASFRQERSRSGRRGAATRWAMPQPSKLNDSAYGSAIKEPMAKNGSASASASASASTTAESAVVGARATPLSVRRRLELVNEGEPVPLRWDQFREIQALAAPSFGGFDAAYGPALGWVHEVGTQLAQTGTPKGAVTNPWQFWRERAEARWCVEAPEVDSAAETIRAALRARGEL